MPLSSPDEEETATAGRHRCSCCSSGQQHLWVGIVAAVIGLLFRQGQRGSIVSFIGLGHGAFLRSIDQSLGRSHRPHDQLAASDRIQFDRSST